MASPTRKSRSTPSVFVDSSVFFAASYSATGSARDLFLAALQGRVSLVLSNYVLEETERNLQMGVSRGYAAFLHFRDTFPFRLRTPSKQLVIDTARVVSAKDAPIIAAARSARVKLVATYDRKDLLSKRQEIFEAFGVIVAPPDEILQRLGET
jgi:predicted nucleic acid-binding protein